MKVSELEVGTKILIPCVRCGFKRSLIFQSVHLLRKQMKGRCHRCGAEEGNTLPENRYQAKHIWLNEMPLHENME